VTIPSNTTALAVDLTRQLALFALLIIATFTDISAGKVHNWLVYPAMALGLALGIAGPMFGVSSPDALDALIGLLLGFGIFGLFFSMGWLGAGDAKLAGAIGAICGYAFFLWALVYMTLAGCMLAVVILIWKGMLLETLKNSVVFFFRPGKLKAKLEASGRQPVLIPYGVAMAAGTMVAWFLRPMA